MAKKTKKSKGGVTYRSAVTGRYVKASPDAAEFSRQFNKKYRSTLRELSKK
jgi:hypothetical protein